MLQHTRTLSQTVNVFSPFFDVYLRYFAYLAATVERTWMRQAQSVNMDRLLWPSDIRV
jgi:hypothetical protein